MSCRDEILARRERSGETPDVKMRAVLSARPPSRWALILGASSGFGEACAVALARAGWNIFGVHLDRKATLAQAEHVAAEIAAAGRSAEFFNVNAADDAKRAEVLAAIAGRCGGDPPESRVSVLLH